MKKVLSFVGIAYSRESRNHSALGQQFLYKQPILEAINSLCHLRFSSGFTNPFGSPLATRGEGFRMDPHRNRTSYVSSACSQCKLVPYGSCMTGYISVTSP